MPTLHEQKLVEARKLTEVEAANLSVAAARLAHEAADALRRGMPGLGVGSLEEALRYLERARTRAMDANDVAYVFGNRCASCQQGLTQHEVGCKNVGVQAGALEATKER